MLVIGVLGIELFTKRLSLLILLAGLAVLFVGWRFFRAVLFPWALSFLMIPPPAIILQEATFPLQLLAARLATLMIEIVGVPVHREGNVLSLANGSLDVVQACSGIRSLLSLVTLAIIYGYLLEKRLWVRVVLAASAIPIAVFANGFRIFGTGMLVQYWDPEKAEGFFHTFQGWLIFVVSLILLFTVHGLISLIWRPSRALKSDPAPIVEVEKGSVPRSAMADRSPRFLVVAPLLLATAVGLQILGENEIFPSRQPLSEFPFQIDTWSAQNDSLSAEELDILGHPEYVIRTYSDTTGHGNDIDLFIAYYPTQKAGETPHTPAHCLPGNGLAPIQRDVVQLAGPDGQFPVNRYVVEQGGQRQLVLYWFQAHGRMVANEYYLKYYLIADSIRLHRSDGALVRLMSPMSKGETADAAQARVMRVGSHFLPLLDSYIPR
jgi:exosortase D (VPLPA-CTERM-specific)